MNSDKNNFPGEVQRLRIIFMGTPEFAVPCLNKLLDTPGMDVSAVFTRPDQPKGRGYHLTPPPVKEAAAAHGIPVFQPTTLKDENVIETIRSLNPDVIAVVAYGKILPEAVLNIPKLGCINVHASLLPKYRGAGPIQWSVLNGEKKTGVTTMYMAKGIDTGDMILSDETAIGINETFGELHDRLMPMGADLLLKTLQLIGCGKTPREKQDDAASCYAPMIEKSMANIDWNEPAAKIHNLVRGLNPWPYAMTVFRGKKMKLIRSEWTDELADAKPGEVIRVDDKGISVCCGDKRAILISEVQEEGKKRLPAVLYVVGHPVKAGMMMGA